MSDDPLFVGADVSAGSWVAVAFAAESFDHAAVFEEVGDLWLRYEEVAERILLDVPIGLIEEGSAGRACERLARQVLGSRRASVFTPPVREATRKRRYPAAKRVNERKTGTGITKQAFAISDEIAAVDELLQELPEAREVIAEAHPEVCFRAFAGEPLSYSKRIAGGYAERMRTLAEYDRDAPPVVQSVAEATDGAEVGVDDVLDAVVLAYTARPGPGDLRTLPPDPETDATGLPMRMVYRAPDPLVGEGAAGGAGPDA
jgi:predicted RNase H-like nuclease